MGCKIAFIYFGSFNNDCSSNCCPLELFQAAVLYDIFDTPAGVPHETIYKLQ